jgi:protein-S-isoprenylcysteine O-methyltransferase Ste14
MSFEKDWRVDLLPIAFFAVLVAAKSYYLVGYLDATGELWGRLAEPEVRGAAGARLGYYLTGRFSYIAYYATALAFDALVLYSFLVRRRAKVRPRGFAENVFPLITVFLPVVGYTLLFLPDVRAAVPPYPEPLLRTLHELTPAFPFYLNMLGLMLGLAGAAFSIWSIAHLRASFGLRAAVRELVTTGPYQRIRHPLYLGEIVHILGLTILAATPLALALFVVAVLLQVARAKIEERKFLATLPRYAAFRDQTGFLWPKLGRRLSRLPPTTP